MQTQNQDRPNQRRNFLKASILFAGTGLMGGDLFGQGKKFIDNGDAQPQQHLTCYPDTEEGKHQLYQLWVRKNNTALTTYRAHPTQKYPFFYPLAGPVSGLSLTSESGRPWPHHRSVFFGADRVNGGNYWQDRLERGQIISQGPSFGKDADGKYKVGPDSVEIVDRCLWIRPEQSKAPKDAIIEDNRVFTITLIDDRHYILDAKIDVKALVPVTIPKTNHGLFGVRTAFDLAPTGGGNILSSEGGTSQKATEGKPAKWMAFYGQRTGLKESIVEGVAVFCPTKAPHPQFENCPWFTRDYGNCSPMPFNFFKQGEKFQLAEGEEMKLRYQIVAFAGTPQEAELDALWEDFNATVR